MPHHKESSFFLVRQTFRMIFEILIRQVLSKNDFEKKYRWLQTIALKHLNNF